MLEFKEDFPNLTAIANGAYDQQLYDLAGKIKADGRQISLRPLHEFNGKLTTFFKTTVAAAAFST